METLKLFFGPYTPGVRGLKHSAFGNSACTAQLKCVETGEPHGWLPLVHLSTPKTRARSKNRRAHDDTDESN